jgi:HSP20 family protein
MANIIKKENARPATFGSVVDQLFQQNFNRWFDEGFWGSNALQARTGVPVNLRETDKSYELEIVAPGLQKQDFQLNFTGDTLTISFEHEDENNSRQDAGRWLRREYRKQSFTRSFTIDETVDVEKASARYDNGILHLSLPKKEHAQRLSRSINVQ